MKSERSMTNSEIYIQEEANNYFRRNAKGRRSFFIDYLLSIFPKELLVNFDVAEFGIGNGSNLFALKEFANKVHGYEGSSEAVAAFERWKRYHPCKEDFFVQQVNLTRKFQTSIFYDMVIVGFFLYYVDNNEIVRAKKNIMRALKKNGYVYIFDFITKSFRVKNDSRNVRLKVYKRNLDFWLSYFKEFDLIDFRLFDSSKDYLRMNNLVVDKKLPANDDLWSFCALFKLR